MNDSPRRTLRRRVLAAFIISLVVVPITIVPPESTFGQAGGGATDLRIVGMIDLHPPLPDEGDDVQIGILVENRGTTDARDVSVYFYEDDVWFEKEVIDIRAGDTVYVEVYWTADEGDSYLSVAVDPKGHFDEYKDDNRTGIWITVR